MDCYLAPAVDEIAQMDEEAKIVSQHFWLLPNLANFYNQTGIRLVDVFVERI